jgi:hypothetical protein
MEQLKAGPFGRRQGRPEMPSWQGHMLPRFGLTHPELMVKAAAA